MKVSCLRCNIEFHRNDPHDCVEALLEARKADKSLIKDLQDQIAAMRVGGHMSGRFPPQMIHDQDARNRPFMVGRYQ